MPFLPIFSFRRDLWGVTDSKPPSEPGHEATQHRVDKHL